MLPRTPSASFEVPLEMLSACHSRIERQCATLQRLVPHLLAHGANDEARQAATSVMRYFDTAARDHHADEETDLFPALIESMAGSDAVCLHELTESLMVEHRALERQWLRLRVVLQDVARGEAARLDADEVAAFAASYARHIEREEQELLPMAARLLSDGDIDRIGKAMRARRGID